MIVKEKGKEGSKDAKMKNYERQKGKVEKERERQIKKERTKEWKEGREGERDIKNEINK